MTERDARTTAKEEEDPCGMTARKTNAKATALLMRAVG
jgi:hypothetical protein